MQRWFNQMKERPAVRRGIDVGRDLRGPRTDAMSDEARKILFGQTAHSVRAAADTTGGNG